MTRNDSRFTWQQGDVEVQPEEDPVQLTQQNTTTVRIPVRGEHLLVQPAGDDPAQLWEAIVHQVTPDGVKVRSARPGSEHIQFVPWFQIRVRS
jgi:hypothetical protein